MTAHAAVSCARGDGIPSPHPGLVFLHRVHARLLLVEASAIDIDDAISDLAELLDELGLTVHCECSRDIVARWERDYPPRRRVRR